MSIIRTVGQYAPPQSPDEIPTGVGYVPVGSIISWIPGYFSSLNNIGYNRSFGTADTVAAANTYLLPLGWRVCDGGEPNDTVSPIWSSSGKKVPQLHDKRFLQGSLSIVASGEGSLDPDGTIQGSANTIADHIHGISITTGTGTSHNHTISGRSGAVVDAGGNATTHTHTISGRSGVVVDAVGVATTHTHGISNSTGTQSASHTHSYCLPSHRHWVQSRGTSSDGAHSHGAVVWHGGVNDHGGTAYEIAAANGAANTPVAFPSDGSHAHSWGGTWSTDSAGSVTSPTYGDGAQNTYSDGQGGINAWNGGSGYGGTYYASPSTLNQSADHTHGVGTLAVGTEGAHFHAPGTLANSGEGAHFHAVGTLANAAESSHTHSVSGNAGTGSVPSATDNRPQYLRCFMIIRIK